MFLKRELPWILFFGTLIGLSETLIASYSIPYRSVVLTSISILLLSIARFQIPKTGTSFLIIAIAVLFKINNYGVYTCSTSFFLCGPTAMLILGVSYEVFASLFIKKDTFKYLHFVLTCVAAAIVTFSIFALMNTYILKTWDTSRLTEYILLKSLLTAAFSSVFSLLALYLIKIFKVENAAKYNPYVINSVLGIVVIALWVLGSLTKY